MNLTTLKTLRLPTMSRKKKNKLTDLPTPKELYKQINLLFIVLFLGIIILFGVSVFIKITGDIKLAISNQEETGKIFSILLGAFIIILFPLSHLLHKRKIEKLDKSLELSEKLSYFKNSMFVKLLLIEYLCVFNIITFFFFGDPYLLIPASLLLLAFLMNRPAIERISSQLNISIEEREDMLM